GARLPRRCAEVAVRDRAAVPGAAGPEPDDAQLGPERGARLPEPPREARPRAPPCRRCRDLDALIGLVTPGFGDQPLARMRSPGLRIADYALDARTHVIEAEGQIDLYAAPALK